MFAPHRAATVERVRAYPVVIVPQDTTELDVTRAHERMEGAGPLNEPSRLGFDNHVMLAFTPEGLPLGIVDAHVWARDAEEFAKDAERKRAGRKSRPIEAKESHRWLQGYRRACELAGEAGPKAMWVGMPRMTDLGLAWRAFARHGPEGHAKR